jgi:hypothetical protein
VGLLENHISYSRSKDFPITRSSDQPISRFTRFPDHPINQSSDQPMMPSLPLIPRSKGLSRNIPLVSRSPGSPERGGFACAGAQPPSAVGLLENRISYSRSTDHPISRSPDHPISRSPDFRNVPRSYHTSITRQSNLKFTHTDHGDSLQPKSERTRTTQRCDPELPTPYMPHQGVSTRSMEFWFGFGFCQLPIANCHLQPFANCQLPLLANCH